MKRNDEIYIFVHSHLYPHTPTPKILRFARCRNGFLLRSKAPVETDAAIEFYSNQLRSFDRYDFPEEWALCHVSLAKLFIDRKRGKRKANIENSLYHIENAMQVYKQSTHPLLWSDAAMMACGLFRERVGLHEQKAVKKLELMKERAMLDAERGEPRPKPKPKPKQKILSPLTNHTHPIPINPIALENAEAALTVLSPTDQPIRWSRAKREIAFCHMKRFEGDKFHVDEQESIEVCIRNLEEAADVFSSLSEINKKTDKASKASR